MDPLNDLMPDVIVDDDYLTSLGLILPPSPATARGSAFAAYQAGRVIGRQYNSGSGANVHRRMFAYLRGIGDAAAETGPVVDAHPAPAEGPVEQQAPRSSRFRHIMRERLRRERLSQGFADLQALLPPGASSKGGKNDIVGAAVGYIREMEGRKEWLHARNVELLERAATTSATLLDEGGGDMAVKVRAQSEHHSTAVDAFEAVLRRLKSMEELRVTAIRSYFYAGGMRMDVGVVCKIPSCEVDKEIKNALMELDGNRLGMQDPRSSSKPSFTCQVESGTPMS